MLTMFMALAFVAFFIFDLVMFFHRSGGPKIGLGIIFFVVTSVFNFLIFICFGNFKPFYGQGVSHPLFRFGIASFSYLAFSALVVGSLVLWLWGSFVSFWVLN